MSLPLRPCCAISDVVSDGVYASNSSRNNQCQGKEIKDPKLQSTRTSHVVHSPNTSLRIVAVVTFYFIVSIALVFANKFVLNTFDFPYPLFMTWVQLIVAEAFILLGGLLRPAYVFPPPVYSFSLTLVQRSFADVFCSFGMAMANCERSHPTHVNLHWDDHL